MLNIENIEKYMDRIEERYGTAYVQIPNNLIPDIHKSLKHDGLESYTHYAYGFMLLNSFLYKYTHYVDFEEGDYLNMSDLKRVLKYSPSNQKIDAISKRGNGALEVAGFIESTTDIPVSVFWENSKTEDWRYRRIVQLSGASDETRRSLYGNILRTPKFCAYIPDFMVDYRNRTGTLNDYKYTYKVTYKELKEFLFNDKMSLRDLLLYCYIKSRINKKGLAEVSHDTIQRQTGMSRATSKGIVDKLVASSVLLVKKNPNASRLKGVSNTYSVTRSFRARVSVKSEGIKPDKR